MDSLKARATAASKDGLMVAWKAVIYMHDQIDCHLRGWSQVIPETMGVEWAVSLAAKRVGESADWMAGE